MHYPSLEPKKKKKKLSISHYLLSLISKEKEISHSHSLNLSHADPWDLCHHWPSTKPIKYIYLKLSLSQTLLCQLMKPMPSSTHHETHTIVNPPRTHAATELCLWATLRTHHQPHAIKPLFLSSSKFVHLLLSYSCLIWFFFVFTFIFCFVCLFSPFYFW